MSTEKDVVRTWIFALGELGDHSLVFQKDNKFMTEDGVWHDPPPLFMLRGTEADVKSRLIECIAKFSEELKNDDNSSNV